MRWNQLFLLSCLACSPLLAQESTSKSNDTPLTAETEVKALDFWMQKKLDYSTAILKGLSLGDFALIESNAQQMRLLNKVEGFVRYRNTDYRTNLHTFERLTDEVIRQARSENIDGVTLAFNQLTVSCVRCHQTLREPGEDANQSVLLDAHEPAK